MKTRWLLLLLPLLLGLLAAFLLNVSGLPNPTIQVLISLSTLLLLAGIGFSLLLIVAFAAAYLAGQRRREEINQLRADTADDRRRFLQRLDHELKNPLMAIRAGLANFANAPAEEARQEALATVDAQTVRLSRLTTDLRKIAELESRPLELDRVDLEQLLSDVIAANRQQPDGNDMSDLPLNPIELIVPQVPWPLPEITADWDLLYVAVYNLLDNAQKFSQPDGSIEVRAREDGQFVVIEVADTGAGIAPEDLPHIWEELYRGQGGPSAQGSGLGLALVKAIAERHEGSVRIDSKLGQGSVAILRLPITGPQP